MIRIAISGKANSGKNTVGKFISGVMDAAYAVDYAFANPIKELLLNMFPTANRSELYGASKLRGNLIPGTNTTYRQVLLDLGKLGRSYSENIWINKFEDDYNKHPSAELYLVTDLRFQNEFTALNNKQFILIRVKRKESTVINDESETSLDEIPDRYFDHIIDNDQDIDHLRNVCFNIAMPIKNGIKE